MSQRLRRRSSITIDSSFSTTFPANNNTVNLEDQDDYMDSSDSLASTTSDLVQNQTDRPMTRSFAKLQNTQLNENLVLNSRVFNSSLKKIENNSLRSSKSDGYKYVEPPPQTYQIILPSQKPNNLINILENSMLTGKKPSSIIDFPDQTLAHFTKRLRTHDYPMLIKKLSQFSVILNFRENSKEFYELMKILGEIENRLVHYEPDPALEPSQYREDFEVETIKIESAKVFRQYGGIEVFKRIILMSLLVSDKENFNSLVVKKNLNSRFSTSSLRRKNKYFNNESTEISEEKNRSANIITENFSILKIKCKCIHILNRIVCLPKFGKFVVNDLLYPHSNTSNSNQPVSSQDLKNNGVPYNAILLQYLFSLFMFKESRLLSCQLIESILLHMPMLNLNFISNIKYILETIDDEGLSSICRIFAITLSDLDMSEKKYWSIKKHQNSQSSASTSADHNKANESNLEISVRDQNQMLLINTPGLLSRLVNLVRQKDYAIRYIGTNSEIEHWMRYLDEALSDDDENENSSEMNINELNINSQNNSADLHSSLTNYRSGAPENQLYQPALLAATKLNNFVHVLYTLNLLLIGKEKKKVQKTLTKYRLAASLNSLFDYLVWNCRCEYHNSNGVAEQMQVRSPEVAVKIQFLRLIHSFCDHSEFKRVMLSIDEIDEIVKYNKNAPSCLQVQGSMLKIEPRLVCTKEKIGLLSKIVKVIKQEPFSDSFRFWLTRAIESFLRGGTSFSDQLFLIKRGIVEDTLNNILAINFTRPKEVIQSCFDMLGELVKFNSHGFRILDKELFDKEKFNMFMRLINQSLVDSNMFLRSIFLSIEFFENNHASLESEIGLNQILTYFNSFERRINLLCKMINTINLHNLSQENVSCLNTTLVLLMLANRQNKMPQYLAAIQQKTAQISQMNEIISSQHITTPQSSNSQINSSPSLMSQIDTMSNFKDLLMFWQNHYLQKDKDCAGLEQNSRIDFSYWKQTVELLLDSNIKNTCSLNYYLSNKPNDYGQSSKSIDDYRYD